MFRPRGPGIRWRSAIVFADFLPPAVFAAAHKRRRDHEQRGAQAGQCYARHGSVLLDNGAVTFSELASRREAQGPPAPQPLLADLCRHASAAAVAHLQALQADYQAGVEARPYMHASMGYKQAESLILTWNSSVCWRFWSPLSVKLAVTGEPGSCTLQVPVMIAWHVTGAWTEREQRKRYATVDVNSRHQIRQRDQGQAVPLQGWVAAPPYRERRPPAWHRSYRSWGRKTAADGRTTACNSGSSLRCSSHGRVEEQFRDWHILYAVHCGCSAHSVVLCSANVCPDAFRP